MKRTPWILLLVALLCALPFPASAQLSDFAIKKDFTEKHADLKARIAEATNTSQLDSLKPKVDALGIDFLMHKSYLEEALYPKTFDGMNRELHDLFVQTYDRLSLIQTQGTRIVELEGTVTQLSTRLDSLGVERNALFTQLQGSKADLNALRETIRRLQSNMAAKDRLIFALVDTIFLPYGHPVSGLSEIQREAVGRKLDNANVMSRLNGIAADNVRFLQVTELQGKDFANLVEQYQQFSGRWAGLRERLQGIYAEPSTPAKPSRKGVATPPPPSPALQVDSALADWGSRLKQAFWGALEREFSAKGVPVIPFNDAQGFSNSIRAYVQTAKSEESDARVFVEEVWKERIDKEWRDALSKESMLGREEYAALDRLVSELHRERFDMKFILYVGALFLLILVLWWFLRTRSKPAS